MSLKVLPTIVPRANSPVARYAVTYTPPGMESKKAALAGDLSCGATIFPWLVSHTLRFSVKKIYKAILRPLFAILPAGIILFVSASFLQGPLHLLVMAVIGVVLIYPTTRLAIGKGEDVKWALEKLKGLWRSRAQESKTSA